MHATRRALAALALLVLAAGAAAAAGRAKTPELAHTEGACAAFGDSCRAVVESRTRESAAQALDGALGEIARLADSLDRAVPGSALARLDSSAAERRIACAPELWDALGAALDVARETRGAYDPCDGALRVAWDTLTTPRPDPEALAAALERTGASQLQLEAGTRTVRFGRPGVIVDLGPLAPGFALDRAIDRLRASGAKRARLALGAVTSVLADAGEAWTIDVPDPADSTAPALQLTARMAAVATDGSAGDAHPWVLDPRTGVKRYRSATVTVVARSAAQAGALARALLVMGREEALFFAAGRRDLGVLWLERDGSVIEAWRSNLPPVTVAPDAVVRWMD